jgi:hypothetical protein
MMPSSGIQRRVVLIWTDISEERNISIFSLLAEQETRVQMSAYLRTTRRYIPEDGNIHNHSCENLEST